MEIETIPNSCFFPKLCMAEAAAAAAAAAAPAAASIFNTVSKCLEQLIFKSRSVPERPATTSFHTIGGVGGLSITTYLARLVRYAMLSDEDLILTLIYLDRSTVEPNRFNMHRLVSTCALLATKFHQDRHQNNFLFARIAGVSLQDLNRQEIELLKITNFDLFVSHGTFKKYLNATI